MSAPVLTIAPTGKAVSFAFGDEGEVAQAPRPTEDQQKKLVFAASEHWSGTQLPKELASASERLVPRALQRRLSTWASVESEDRTLCVRCDDANLRQLPWELMLRSRFAEVRDLFVARVVHEADQKPPRAPWPRVMLMAGWARLQGIALPGIERELREARERLRDPRLKLVALGDPSKEQVRKECAAQQPHIVHLTSPGVVDWWGKAELAMAGGPAGAGGASAPVEMVSATDVGAMLGTSKNLSLIVLNTCHSGLGAGAALSAECEAACIGWPSYVSDDIAADFSLFFHQRLLENQSILKALRAFAALGKGEQATGAHGVPCVWLPSPEWIDWAPMSAGPPDAEPAKEAPARRDRAEPKRGGPLRAGKIKLHTLVGPSDAPSLGDVLADEGEVPRRSSPLRLDADLEPPTVEIALTLRESINPALLLNGYAPIQHLSFDADRAMHLVRVEIHCDAGNGGSTYCRTMPLNKGRTPFTDLEQIVFPALYDLAARDLPRRKVNFTVRVFRGTGAYQETLAETTRAAQWMGRNEWLDNEALWPFIPAFVQPNARAVRTVIDHARRMLRAIGDPKAEFDGYLSDEEARVENQARAIFQALRDEPFALAYIHPLPHVYEASGRMRAGQLVRFPDELIEHKRGTCHDLALLFAACLEHVGLRPLILLITGHTFVAYWRSADDQQEFWRKARSERGREEQTDATTIIRDLARLRRCLDPKGNGPKIVPFECTFATERDKTFAEAVARGRERIDELEDDDFDAAIDVYQSRGRVQPL